MTTSTTSHVRVERNPNGRPTVIGNYELVNVLGEGALGTTYLARNMSKGRLVAIKAVQLVKSRNRHLIDLFEREVDALKALEHSQIPAFFETLVTEGSETFTLFLVQEFIAGRTLQRTLDEGHTFLPAEVVGIMLSCLSPLAFLHGRETPLYHRDIKPSNIIMRADGSCVLIDFGAIREALADPTAGGSTVIGTYGYMAPEQFQGRVCAATDLYALGATAVHLLTGISPDKIEIKRLKPDIHRYLQADTHLAAVLDLLIEPAPEDRYRSVESLGRALIRWANDHPDEFSRLDEAQPQVPDGYTAPLLGPPANSATMPRVEGRGRSDFKTPLYTPNQILNETLKGPTLLSPIGADRPTGSDRPRLEVAVSKGEAAIFGGAGTSNVRHDSATRESGVAINSPVEQGPPVQPRRRPRKQRNGGADLPIAHVRDPWHAILNPRSYGYARVMGASLTPLGVVIAVSALASSRLGPALGIFGILLVIYGLSFVYLSRRRSSRERGDTYIESTDGLLAKVVVHQPFFGPRYVALHYRFAIRNTPYAGIRIFEKNSEARPFLRKKLTGLVWYDESNPKRNTLDIDRYAY
jgi:serine/threonine protein kinase